MSEAASSTPKKAKKTTTKPKSTHPKYIDMVTAAIKTLNERGGSSRQAIVKYITEHYKVGDTVKNHLKVCLKRGVASGALVQAKGTGASGSFKIAAAEKKTVAPKKKPVTKAKKPAPKAKKAKTPVKKSAAKKTPIKKKPAAKTTKKPAAKKVVKTTKKSPKKTTKAKKPAKK